MTTKIGSLITTTFLENAQIPLPEIQKILVEKNDLVANFRNHIRSNTPFECDDYEALLGAIFLEHRPEWRINLMQVLVSIRDCYTVIRKGNYQGSWNCPIQYVKDVYGEGEYPFYKVLRKTNSIISQKVPYAYEFHNACVPVNEWIQAEISASSGLYGLKPKTEGGCGGRFHLLLDRLQAEAYLSKRTDAQWFTPEVATIVQVNARKFQTIDLVYVPPTTFVWGIDSEEMFVKYEYKSE